MSYNPFSYQRSPPPTPAGWLEPQQNKIEQNKMHGYASMYSPKGATSQSRKKPGRILQPGSSFHTYNKIS
ncbi:hypothetical protein H112_02373 [Trichophyton rubrum D6]|nr:hypothetical protein H100_02374 [Trichophyton rubrum MR850]KDB36091.1 hypothetical protein H112_02373 [Trichophyton rubrum D6]